MKNSQSVRRMCSVTSLINIARGAPEINCARNLFKRIADYQNSLRDGLFDFTVCQLDINTWTHFALIIVVSTEIVHIHLVTQKGLTSIVADILSALFNRKCANMLPRKSTSLNYFVYMAKVIRAQSVSSYIQYIRFNETV